MFRRLLYFDGEELLIPEHIVWGNIVLTFLQQSASQMGRNPRNSGTMVKISKKRSILSQRKSVWVSSMPLFLNKNMLIVNVKLSGAQY